MIKKLAAAALVSAGLAGAVSAQVDFDRGADLRDFVSRASGLELVPAAQALDRNSYSRDCARFSFGPSDKDVLGDRVWLKSVESVTECHTVMHPGPNGTQVPEQQCYERPGMSWNQAGQIKILARKLWPWERESFEICLSGPWMELYEYAAGYKYSLRREGNYDTVFELTPHEKIAMHPDEDGLSAGEFSYADGKYSFKVNDKWAKEYAGEKVAVKVDLYQDKPYWFDGFKGSKEFVFDAAEGYTMTFAGADLDTSKAVFEPETRGSKKFYLKWGFKRVGVISKDDFIKKGETPAIEAK